MEATNTPTITAYGHAEKAIKVLHNQVLNPPTSIATAILPVRMADRLNLASTVFDLEHFLEARKQDRSELVLISAALPVLYLQVEMLADALGSASAPLEDPSPASAEPDHFLKVTLPRSKIDLARGIAELPPARTSSIQVVFSDGSDSLASEGALPEERLAIGLADTIWAGVCSFRGLL